MQVIKNIGGKLAGMCSKVSALKKHRVGNQFIKSPQNSGSWLRYYNLYPQMKTQVLQNESVSCRPSSQEPASITLSVEQGDPSSGTPAIPNAPGKRWR